MTPAPETPRASRNRRQGDTLGLLARLAGAVALVLLIAALFNLSIHKLERSPPVQPEYQPSAKIPRAEPVKATSASPAEVVQGIERLEEKRSQIETVIRAFFKAATVEDKLAFARAPERVRPLLRDYYRQRPFQPRTVTGLGTCQSVGEKGYRLGYIQALFAQETPVSVIVEEQEDKQFRVDWESLVRYSEMEWADFIRQRPETPTMMRVMASQSVMKPAEGREWLQISSPGHDHAIQAYFDRNDPKFQPLVDQLQAGGWKNVPLTLRLCYSKPKLNADTVQIVNCEGKGWLILN
ncbi:hypothetical protein [Prosthecobacter dejongeii]|uniref:Putative RNA-binding protein associated with RNAse of E/G family n=1 Tax=Prosthecobacter dejongeii TaxID=48465 RepID=A0A7W7YIN6_9BACT|nr:hypothetical protein [Prosthecobacter dejongeii]MBB5036931.1 putative RNA-binding protein associated with RNAse of E/G family [Prosthecobacter dejongeii]